MNKVEKIDWQKFIEFSKKLIEYKAKHSRVSINAESWEEVIYVSFLNMLSDRNVFWEVGSHAKGVDIELIVENDRILISAKGGKINVKDYLSLSSYRLTRYKTIEDKLDFLHENARKLDIYLICSRTDTRRSIIYRIFKINSLDLVPSLFLDSNNWSENSQAWIFNKHKEAGLEARIVKSMSHQLWYSIPIRNNKLEELSNIEIAKKDLGKLLLDVIK